MTLTPKRKLFLRIWAGLILILAVVGGVMAGLVALAGWSPLAATLAIALGFTGLFAYALADLQGDDEKTHQ